MKKNVFVVSTPLVMINAQEALLDLCKDDYNILIVIYPKSSFPQNRLIQMFKILEVALWNEVKVWSTNTFGVVSKLQLLVGAVIRGVRYAKCNRLFVNNTERKYLRTLVRFASPIKVYLLDDGLQTISIAHTRNLAQKDSLFFPLIKSLNFYTAFDFSVPKSDEIIKNNYNKLNLEPAIYPNKIKLFFGQPLGKASGVRQDSYLRFVAILLSDPVWQYVPHPGESTEVMNLISDAHAGRVFRLDTPPEVEFRLKPDLLASVEEVSAICSTLLMTLPLMYKDNFIISLVRPTGDFYVDGEPAAVKQLINYLHETGTDYIERSVSVS